MIIADTNIWVSFFKGEKKAFLMKELITQDKIVLHPYIIGELLLGGISEKAELLLSSLGCTDIIDTSTVYKFIKTKQLKSKGIGWVDVNILMTAIENGYQIYSFDEDLKDLCVKYNCFFRVN